MGRFFRMISHFCVLFMCVGFVITSHPINKVIKLIKFSSIRISLVVLVFPGYV